MALRNLIYYYFCYGRRGDSFRKKNPPGLKNLQQTWTQRKYLLWLCHSKAELVFHSQSV